MVVDHAQNEEHDEEQHVDHSRSRDWDEKKGQQNELVDVYDGNVNDFIDELQQG
jgi:hypothetical protein